MLYHSVTEDTLIEYLDDPQSFAIDKKNCKNDSELLAFLKQLMKIALEHKSAYENNKGPDSYNQDLKRFGNFKQTPHQYLLTQFRRVRDRIQHPPVFFNPPVILAPLQNNPVYASSMKRKT